MPEPFMIDLPSSGSPWACSSLRPGPGFEDVAEPLVYEQDYQCLFDDYTAPGLGDAHPGDATLFVCCPDSPLTDQGGGLAQFTRTYSKLPPDRVERESYAFTFPGLSPGGIYTPHGLEPDGVNSGGLTTLTSLDAHGFVATDLIFIRYATAMLVNDASSSFMQLVQTRKFEVQTAPTSTTFTVNEVVGTSPQFIYAVKASSNRKPPTKTVTSKIEYEYFFCDDESEVDAITILERFQPESGDGEENVDTLSESSDPTQSDYISTIVGDWIVAEDSIVRRWRGKIWERATRYVIAQ